MTFNKVFKAVVFGALLVCFASLAVAADTVPIKVTSDKLAYDASGKKVSFSGNVHVTHPDAELWANSIAILLTSNPTAKKDKSAEGQMDPGQIDRIIAQGSVRVLLTDGQTGSCEKATYVIGPGVLTMEGNPVLEDGQNSIQGHIIRFDVKQKKSEVLGAPNKPVEAVFTAPKRLKK